MTMLKNTDTAKGTEMTVEMQAQMDRATQKAYRDGVAAVLRELVGSDILDRDNAAAIADAFGAGDFGAELRQESYSEWNNQ